VKQLGALAAATVAACAEHATLVCLLERLSF
jgi:hypothetical protein